MGCIMACGVFKKGDRGASVFKPTGWPAMSAYLLHAVMKLCPCALVVSGRFLEHLDDRFCSCQFLLAGKVTMGVTCQFHGSINNKFLLAIVSGIERIEIIRG